MCLCTAKSLLWIISSIATHIRALFAFYMLALVRTQMDHFYHCSSNLIAIKQMAKQDAHPCRKKYNLL